MDLENDENSAMYVRRGSLLTSREKQLVDARAQIQQMSEEMERLRVEAANAKKEAEELRERIVVTKEPPVAKFRSVAAGLGAALMLTVVGKVSYDSYHRLMAPAVAASPATPLVESVPQMKETAASDTKKVPARASRDRSPHSAVDAQFSRAINRLETDFDSLPGEQADIIKEINKKQPSGPKACPLEVRNGSVAIPLDGKTGGVSSTVVNAINKCAEAAENLRATKAAAEKTKQPPEP